jgi:hypothetical protein
MVGCVVTEHEWPAIARARTVAVVQNAPSQGASTSPFTSQRYRLDAQPFQGHRPVDWHGMAWHGGSLLHTLQTADSLHHHQRVLRCNGTRLLYSV